MVQVFLGVVSADAEAPRPRKQAVTKVITSPVRPRAVTPVKPDEYSLRRVPVAPVVFVRRPEGTRRLPTSVHGDAASSRPTTERLWQLRERQAEIVRMRLGITAPSPEEVAAAADTVVATRRGRLSSFPAPTEPFGQSDLRPLPSAAMVDPEGVVAFCHSSLARLRHVLRPGES